jgi:hypothetical protein
MRTSRSESPKVRSQRPSQRTDRRQAARRLLMENLETRCLMAFDVLPSSPYSTGANPVRVELAFVNGDSNLDMVVANSTGASIDVLLGNGDGTFGEAQTSPTGLSPNSIAVGDFDGDGFPDVVTANYSGVNLLTGNGNGTFDAPQAISLPTQKAVGDPDKLDRTQYPISVAAGDLNGDDKIDLIVGTDTYFSVKYPSNYVGYYYYSNYYDGHVNVLLGNGTGLGAAQVQDLGSNRLPYAVAVGDVTGEGNADVIAASNSDLSVFVGDGQGGLAAPQFSGSGSALPSISLGDVDGDSEIDTILRGGNGLVVQKGDGAGHFTTLPSVSTGNWANSAVLGDVNADGKLDIVSAGVASRYISMWPYYGYYMYTPQASVLLGNGDGNFALPLVSDLAAESASYFWLPDIAVANLTGDALLDLVALEYYSGTAIVATNNGSWIPPASIVISDVTVTEGDSGSVNAVFTVTLIGDHGAVSVGYSTSNYTATAGSDYTSIAGTLNFAANESSKTISVAVLGDAIDEYDQQFYVLLSNPSGALLGDSVGVGTIVDNDAAPTIVINNVTANEGQKGNTSFNFTVSLSAVSEKWIYVNFATANGTATTADSDYVSRSGTLSFSPGQTAAMLTITVRADKKKEADETFIVKLSGAVDATIADDQGLGTIVNDDGGQGNSKGPGKPAAGAVAAAMTVDTTTTKKRK